MLLAVTALILVSTTEAQACSCAAPTNHYPFYENGKMPANGFFPVDWFFGRKLEFDFLREDQTAIPTLIEEYPTFHEDGVFSMFWPTEPLQVGQVVSFGAVGTDKYRTELEITPADHEAPVLHGVELIGPTRTDFGTCGDRVKLSFELDATVEPGEDILVRTEDLETGRTHWYSSLSWTEVCGGPDPAYYDGPKEVVLIDAAGNMSEAIEVRPRKGACGCGGHGTSEPPSWVLSELFSRR